jgi:hypothetical protein
MGDARTSAGSRSKARVHQMTTRHLLNGTGIVPRSEFEVTQESGGGTAR